MNELGIGKKVLMLRKEKNITQEELALKIGISAGAVSKWENGNSMPDISMIAPLARALNTSIDNLFSFEQDISKDTVNKIKEELMIVFMRDGYDAGESECKKYLNQYSNNIYLKITLAELLEVNLMMAKDCSEEIIKDKYQECLKIFNEVVESNEVEYVPSALFHLAHINMIIGNYEESEKSLKKLPQNLDPVTLYPVILMKQDKDDEASKLCSNKLLNYINNSCLMLTMLSKISCKQGNIEKAFFYLDTCHRVQEIFKIDLKFTANKYIELNLANGNKELAAKWFKTYVEEIIEAPYDYENNPYFNDIVLEVKPDMQKIIRRKMLKSIIDDEKFNMLKGMDDYEEAIKKVKAKIK